MQVFKDKQLKEKVQKAIEYAKNKKKDEPKIDSLLGLQT